MQNREPNVVILGGGMVGLCVAKRLIDRKITTAILLIEKESDVGLHTSGRNSGVIHAGLYYKPDSLKAKVCVNGAERLKRWIRKRGLPLNECGKVVVAQRPELEEMLDELKARGLENGADVIELEKIELMKKIPDIAKGINRAIWSKNTAVTKPLLVVQELCNELRRSGVKLIFNECNLRKVIDKKTINLSDETEIEYDYLFNCSGQNAEELAKQFGQEHNYKLMPFKGIYWDVKQTAKLNIETNLYPVPDLEVPFLGVHFTPDAYNKKVSLGPTATPAWGKENYRGMENFNSRVAIETISTIAEQYIRNEGGFRNYIKEQLLLAFKPFVVREAQQLIPKLKNDDLELSCKVGIRPQLYDTKERKLIDDFITLQTAGEMHVLNAISPAFTASFELADLIIDRSHL